PQERRPGTRTYLSYAERQCSRPWRRSALATCAPSRTETARHMAVRLRIAAMVLSSAVVPRKGQPSWGAHAAIQESVCRFAVVSRVLRHPPTDSHACASERHAVGMLGQHSTCTRNAVPSTGIIAEPRNALPPSGVAPSPDVSWCEPLTGRSAAPLAVFAV